MVDSGWNAGAADSRCRARRSERETMTAKSAAASAEKGKEPTGREKKSREETRLEALAGYCSVLVVGLFILTFLVQNFVIPSGSMENTLLVGDHLLVGRITLAPQSRWMPLEYTREPRRGDVVVFIKPVQDLVNGRLEYQFLVKRLIGVPGDRLRLNHGIVVLNGVTQSEPYAQPTTAENYRDYIDDFPAIPMTTDMDATEEWSVEMPSHVVNGELVVPPGMYFMMGDNRHNSLDSRFWGFVPRANIIGRPIVNYWSFEATESDLEGTGLASRIAWMGHVALHFFTDTRWRRTLHVVR
jgi:signal peptidase I